MKKMLLACLGVLFMFSQCSKDSPPGTPACIKARIAQMASQPKSNPRGEIHEYLYNGQLVYLVTAPCCDQYDTLLNANCEYICAPSGGFTGKGDGKCADFSEKAKHSRVIWKDER